MKVLWIAPYPYTLDQHPAPWIQSLAIVLTEKSNVELTILTTSNKISVGSTVVHNGSFQTIFLGVPSFKRDILTLYQERIFILRKWLQKNSCKYDLIHIHGTEHQYEVAAYKVPIPKVISIQGLLYRCVKIIPETYSIRSLAWNIGAFYEKRYIPKYSHYLCRTTWDTSSIRSLQPDARIDISWEIIRKDFFIEDSIDFFHNKNLLFMGGLVDIKGISETLQAFNKLLLVKEELKLLILGHGTNEELKNLVNKLDLKNIDLEKNIEFRGKCNVNKVVEAMSTSFCLLHPSYIDNSPNSICEAQIFGLPVIATNVGGVSTLIDHRRTGLLISMDVDEIYSSVLELLEDEDLFHKISYQSLKLARKRHDTNEVLESLLKSYQIAINEQNTCH